MQKFKLMKTKKNIKYCKVDCIDTLLLLSTRLSTKKNITLYRSFDVRTQKNIAKIHCALNKLLEAVQAKKKCYHYITITNITQINEIGTYYKIEYYNYKTKKTYYIDTSRGISIYNGYYMSIYELDYIYIDMLESACYNWFTQAKKDTSKYNKKYIDKTSASINTYNYC